MKIRFAAASLLVLIVRALRVRLSVAPRARYWEAQLGSGTDGPLFVALGDSLTQGIGSSRPSTSWVGRFAAHWESVSGLAPRLDNRAVYGAKAADVLAGQLPLPAGVSFVTLCVGANDAGRTAPEVFGARLREVCEQLPRGSIVGDVPEFQWGPRTKEAAELSAIVRSVVAEYPALILAEVEQHTTGTKVLTELAGDFFHPGDRGYARIARAFTEAFDQTVITRQAVFG